MNLVEHEPVILLRQVLVEVPLKLSADLPESRAISLGIITTNNSAIHGMRTSEKNLNGNKGRYNNNNLTGLYSCSCQHNPVSQQFVI